jgi:hypothetical protein
MRWPAAMAFAAVLAAGCHRTPQALDPFLPSTRIPPPPTGAATGAPDANYINPAPPYSGASPAYPPQGVAPAAGSNGLFAPPGGNPYQQSAPTPAPADGGFGPVPAPINHSSSAPAGRDGTDSRGTRLVSHEVMDDNKAANHVTTVDEEPSAVYEHGEAAPMPAASKPTASQAIDIMDLPPVVRSPRQTVRKPLAEAVAASRYDHSDNYGWLRGQLEYSPDASQWKLRYLPIDGPADRFDGSVILEGELPGHYRAGDFVVVEGQPEDAAAGRQGDTLYRVAAMGRQPE